jgi:hypothetical protein
MDANNETYVMVVEKSAFDDLNSFEDAEDDVCSKSPVSRRQTRSVAAGKRIARNTARSKTSNRVTILKAPGRRDQPPITGPAKNAQSLKQKEVGSNTIPPTSEQRVEDLPIVLYVPGNHGKIHYPSIE